MRKETNPTVKSKKENGEKEATKRYAHGRLYGFYALLQARCFACNIKT